MVDINQIPSRRPFSRRRKTAVSHKKQRELAKAIKRARFLGLLPYVVK
jgi:small subunit ribosomal protein S18